ncbi:MAG TPA: HD domain-containing protein [Thermoanaerobacterales bacterium]|jgi:tRNA nucleotidyltransferase (CCA-adding enzyme)|nr:HD domain-containing protein [Thermoanaerobacterales bacterium]
MFHMNLPFFIEDICKKLKASGFKAYIVGGAIRDLIMDSENFDFDIATNALPNEISSVFPKAKPYGNFGTMLVIANGTKVEITPFRDDAPGRKPDYTFGGSIYTDLARRDFTINSIAYDPISDELIDPHRGMEDIKKGVIRCTGTTERIWEDPLRAMRAARFQAQLGFSIESSTLYALKAQSQALKEVSKERIRDELIKLLTGDYCFDGLVTLVITELMEYIIPELMLGMGMMHYNKPFDVLHHNLVACKIIRNTLPLRLAALLHDVAKPKTAISGKKGLEFPNHHIESASLAHNILRRLRFDNKTIKKVVVLIQNHMFYYSPNTPTSHARRLISKIGWDNIYDLIDLRVADRIASGFDRVYCPGLKKLINDLEILKDEHSDYQIKDLAVTGQDIIEQLGFLPGPRVGYILEKLLDAVIENPQLNNKTKLLNIAKEV